MQATPSWRGNRLPVFMLSLISSYAISELLLVAAYSLLTILPSIPHGSLLEGFGADFRIYLFMPLIVTYYVAVQVPALLLAVLVMQLNVYRKSSILTKCVFWLVTLIVHVALAAVFAPHSGFGVGGDAYLKALQMVALTALGLAIWLGRRIYEAIYSPEEKVFNLEANKPV